MTISELTLIISVMCKLNVNYTPSQQKLICIENYTNCAIYGDGKTDRKRTQHCIDTLGYMGRGKKEENESTEQ